MRVLFVLFFIGRLQLSSAHDVLKEAVKDYLSLKNEIDKILSIKQVDCNLLSEKSSSQKLCHLKNYCELLSKTKDSPLIYANKQGGKIYNSNLEKDALILRGCLKETFANEIQASKKYASTIKNNNRIQKLLDLNKKLKVLLDKNQENSNLQIITGELLNMSLKEQKNNNEINWNKKGATVKDLSTDIALAEKKSKTKLSSETKNTLIEMQKVINSSEFQKEEKEFEDSIFPNVENKNIFYNWTLLTDMKQAGSRNKLDANREYFQKKSQDAYNLFKSTKEKMIQYLEGTKNDMNANQIERAIERIRTVKFNPPILSESVKVMCEKPNAFYSPEKHSLTLCPQLLESPSIVLIDIIAHEIAHSFDPCTLSAGISKKFGPEIVENAPFAVPIKMDPIVGNYSVLYYDSGMNDKNVFQSPMKYRDNPFSNTISCLKTPESIGAVVFNKDQIREKLHRSIAEIKLNGQTDNNSGVLKYYNVLDQQFDDFFNYNEGCDFKGIAKIGSGLSQIQESFADKIASEVIAKELSSSNISEAQENILALIASYPDGCTDMGSVDKKLVKIATKYQCPGFFASKSFEEKILQGWKHLDTVGSESHPEDIKRINKIFMAHPNIKQSLGCAEEKDGAKYCE